MAYQDTQDSGECSLSKIYLLEHFLTRALCGGGKVERFSDLSSVMRKSNIKSLRSVYQDVADIDLFVGGLMEKKLAGGLLGPTFSCIIADQVLIFIISYLASFFLFRCFALCLVTDSSTPSPTPPTPSPQVL